MKKKQKKSIGGYLLAREVDTKQLEAGTPVVVEMRSAVEDPTYMLNIILTFLGAFTAFAAQFRLLNFGSYFTSNPATADYINIAILVGAFLLALFAFVNAYLRLNSAKEPISFK